jgi:ABC-type Na+ efflux pump permease subunit
MILWIARREWLEQRRQPAMLAAIAALFVAIGLVVVSTLAALDFAARRPEVAGPVAATLSAVGVGERSLSALADTVVTAGHWLVLTQYLGITAVLAGHALLHDRQCGTLPILWLAPVGRVDWLAGKVLGAIGPATVLYLGLGGAAAVVESLLPITEPAQARLPPSPAWGIAFLFGGPIWAAFISAVCALISGSTRDVRTAQQLVWLVMFFATFACGFLLAGLIGEGVAVQLGVAAAGLCCVALTLAAGRELTSRDLDR